MTLFLHLLPEWTGATWLAIILCVISTVRLSYWQYFKKDDALAKQRARDGIPTAEENRGVPQGPKGWPLVGNLSTLGHEPHRTLADLAQIYGDVLKVQLGSFPTLVVSAMSLAKEVLVKQAAHFSPTGETVRITEFALGWTRLQLGSKDASTRFKTTTTALTDALKTACASSIVERAINRASKGLVEAVREELADAASGSPSESSQVTGLRETLRRAALDVLLDIAFGVRLGRVSSLAQTADEGGERRGSLAMLELILPDIWQLVNTAVLADHVPILRVATGEVTNRCRFLARQRDWILRDLVDEAKKAPSKADSSAGESAEGRDTLVKALLAGQEASGLADGEVVDVLADFLQRGALPIAATVEWALAELANHPEIQRKLHLELEVEAFGREGEEPRKALERTRLLSAVILETLRLHPTTPISAPRRALNDLDLGGYKVARGQNVVVNSWGLGRDARLFRSPSDFLPERFLPKALPSLLEAKDLYWSSLGADRSDLTVDIVAHFVAALLRRFEWLPGFMKDTRPLREGPGIEVSELSFPLAANAKIR